MTEIKTYPEMNEMIVSLLRFSGEPIQLYAAQLIEELQRTQMSLPKWIPVTERLPKEMDRSCGGWSAEIRPSDDVLVWLSSEKRQSVAWYSHTYNEWTTVDENTVYYFGEVTHWMPLPSAPTEE